MIKNNISINNNNQNNKEQIRIIICISAILYICIYHEMISLFCLIVVNAPSYAHSTILV